MTFKIISLIIPVYVFIAGIMMKIAPENSITKVIGYKGMLFEKTEEMKKESFKICSIFWIVMGMVLISLSIVVMMIAPDKLKLWFMIILLVIQMGFMVGTVVFVEMKILKKFKQEAE